MPEHRLIAVIDIGKTNAKVALVDLESLTELQVRTMPNQVLSGPPYPHYDTVALWSFIYDAIKAFNADRGVDAISVSAHGATLALINEQGNLAAPIVDYEFSGFDDSWQNYQAIRPPFEETGSPSLPGGLNTAAQLYWIKHNCPELWQGIDKIIGYPQYWSGHLTGVFVNEVTSLGSHTDLWDPHNAKFSSIVDRLDIADKMAEIKPASFKLGYVRPDIAGRCGLSDDVAVYCGIHDSNASLYPYLLQKRGSFNVVSTGTWVISMAIGAKPPALDPAHDTLVNVNAFGDRVPSARFMGGREFAMMVPENAQSPDEQTLVRVLESDSFICPQVVDTAGPFLGRSSNWKSVLQGKSSDEVYALASLYLALVSAESLKAIGVQNKIIVEGPFAKNNLYLEMLAVATGKSILVSSGSDTGTTIGAALLAGRDLKVGEFECIPAFMPHLSAFKEAFASYRDRWRNELQRL